ncbi:Imidazole glycerol phosphate synthase subunit HisH [Candidatus Lokiarchaeum ossiferum]|uniref:Imidazole glycerol phosphate synthase subunit HisH n=1 Tax=Candidatus Lokiarchaeum ossiferum TaxID=2951803 RepID=A0ABY6HTY2_9ARCH|nr:Imidazole glycerol phosphate synthase subunit HisH [Candidatus Lokiarchaeum sp. B-35]
MDDNIAIIDIGSGNLQSVQKVLKYLGKDSEIIVNPEKISKFDKVILPGVGNFGKVMEGIRSRGFETPIKEIINQNTKFLGICVGMQVLFESSDESPGCPGLCSFKGKVLKFQKGKIPQIGWNLLEPRESKIISKGYVYYVNSYYVQPENESLISATSDYYGEFTGAIQFKNLTAVQFHPEKSGEYGIEFYRRWLSC